MTCDMIDFNTDLVTVSLNWTAADDLMLSWYISSQITSLNGTITVEMRLAGSSLQWMPVEQNHKLLQSNNYQVIALNQFQ